jgi:peptide/nickel transport system substrate-binding protein
MIPLVRSLTLGVALFTLAACGTQPLQSQAATTVERVVTRVVTRVVESGPEVRIETAREVLAPTVDSERAEISLVLCMSAEPGTLLWPDTAVGAALYEAIREPLYDRKGYGYQANLVEKLPSFDDGDATMEEVTISEGDVFYDAATDRVLTLSEGMVESFTLKQADEGLLVVEQWDGSALSTVQVSAEWTLVDGLTWEDGTPVTATDSVFAYYLERDPNYIGPNPLAERTASYEAIGERTVRWTGIPGYTDSNYLINVWTPRPSHLHEGMDWATLMEDEAANRRPLAYGPYVIEEWVAAEQIVLSPNPFAHRGRPPLDRLLVRFLPDVNQLVAQLAGGGCDVGTQDTALNAALPVVRQFESQGLLRVLEVPGTAYEHLNFNTTPAPGYTGAAATLRDSAGGLLFALPPFRHAIAHCLDRQAIINSAAHGAGAVQHTYVASDHPFYPGDDALPIYEFNPERGRALLEELGWTDTDGDGVRDDGQGTRLAFVHSTLRTTLREAITQIINHQLLENCGVETEIELSGPGFFAQDGPLATLRFDLAQFGFSAGVEPFCLIYTTAALPDPERGRSSNNVTGWSDPAFDAACAAALQTTDEGEKARQHAEAMRIFNAALPSIPLMTRSSIVVVRPEVEGVILDPTARDMWNVENFDFNAGR